MRTDITKRVIVLLAVLAGFGITATAQLLYRIEGNGLERPSYIFGTHHLAPLSTLDSISGAWEAYRGAEQVVGEIDMTVDQMTMGMEMQPYMIAPQDSTISKLLGEERFAKASEAFMKITGMPLQMMDPLRPMVAETAVVTATVQREMPDFNPQEQMDMYFQLQGEQTGKRIRPLETAAQQAELLFCSTPLTHQADVLMESLDNPEKGAETARRLNAAYRAQDLEEMVRLTEEEDSDPEFMERLVERRNRNWVSVLPGIMAEGPAFIAVGALHLPGDTGVIQLLRNEGYSVTPAGPSK